MTTLDTRNLALVVLLSLVGAVGYSQIRWRRDRVTFDRVRERLAIVNQQKAFPADGDQIAASPLRVIRGSDPLPLGDLARGHRTILYFDRPDCPSCTWLEQQLDSVLPRWRDSLVTVTSYGTARGPVRGLTLDSVSSRYVTGVPALVVVDSTGVVNHSVAAGLPPVMQVMRMVGLPVPLENLLKAKDIIRAQAATAPHDTASTAQR